MAKNPPIRVTEEQTDRLLADVLSLPSEPIGAHLSDDEFIGYAMETPTESDVDHIDEHLASCADCTVELERFLEAADAWQGEVGEQRLNHMRESLLTALNLARTQLWLQVVGVIVFSAVHLARTRRQGLRFQADTLYQHWVDDEVTCILSEDEESFVFSVDTTDERYHEVLLRFALSDARTGDEYVDGLLILHPDLLNAGHYVASARLDTQATLPEQCQPRLARVTLEASQPLDDDTVLAAVASSYEEADRQAWHAWAQREAEAGHLSQTVAGAIWRVVTDST
jgi:hypothetical protein